MFKKCTWTLITDLYNKMIKPLKVSQKTGFLNKEDIGMVNKYIKRCTTSLVSMETNNNNSTYHYTPNQNGKD